jgi:hypothetical protein
MTKESIADRLLESSIRFARSAIAAYAEESWDVFYLHLATAVEQLMKGVLARAHPTFIADTRSNSRDTFDSLLHLAGFGHLARTPDSLVAVRTIPAEVALDRVGLFVDAYQQPSALVVLLIKTRNGIVHAGHQAKAESDATLGDVGRYVHPLLSALRIDPADYWGDSAEIVAAHAQRRLDASEAAYRRRLQAARDRHAQMVSGLDIQNLETIVAAVDPGPASEPFTSFRAKCPACGATGQITGWCLADWQLDGDIDGGLAHADGMYVAELRVQADRFRCGVCGLDLGAEHLAFAGLDAVILASDDFDVAAATTFFQGDITRADEGV